MYSKRQRAEGRGQKAEDRRQKGRGFCLFLPFTADGAPPVGRFCHYGVTNGP
ncbi:MAG: hypothetical protein F6J96_27310 [Symploca sp. SIO1C2]|nr:hypothetical protein [Symploca sp. SIO1C2]